MPHEFSHVVCRFLCQRRPAHVAHSSVFRTRSRHSPVQDVGIYDSPAYARKNQTGRLHSPALVLAPICERLGTADEETLSLTANRQVRKLERGLGVLELITTIAPILGLTGTVTGMISTFQAIGEHGSRVDPSVLAGGIWEALITTAAGLLVALPAHVAYHFLENRLSELIQTVQEIVDVRRIAFCGISHEN